MKRIVKRQVQKVSSSSSLSLFLSLPFSPSVSVSLSFSLTYFFLVSRQMSDQILSHLSPQILEPLLLSILHQSSLPSSPSTPPIMDLLLWIFSPLLLSPTTHKHAHSLIVHRFLTEITLSEDVRKGISDALCFFPDPLPVPSRKSVEVFPIPFFFLLLSGRTSVSQTPHLPILLVFLFFCLLIYSFISFCNNRRE